MSNFTIGDPVKFDCYGHIVKGTFLRKEGNLIYFTVISDTLGVETPGDEGTINEKFLIE